LVVFYPNSKTFANHAQAVLSWGFQYAGPADEAEALLAPFNAIGAVLEDMGDASYPTISGVTSETCGSAARAISSVMTLDYHLKAERELSNHFVTNVAAYPEIGASAYLWHEGYATAGFQAIPSNSTAYPHRDENRIM
jgi:hypothetical protein